MKRLFSLIACIAVVAAVAVAVPQVVAPGAAARGSGPGAAVATETGGPQTSGSEESAVQATASGGSDSPNYEDGVVLVELRDGATAADLNAVLPELDYIATKQVADDDIARGYARLELSDGISVESAEGRIADENPGLFEFAQPNFLYHTLDDAASAPTPFIAGIIAQTTSIDDTYRSKQWALEKVQAYDAWDTARADAEESQRVAVAVIDNGCQTDHPDLADNIVASYNAVEPTDAVRADFGDHGTHVCGIVSAVANNGAGVAGVSYNAGLVPIQAFYETVVTDEETGTTKTVAETDSQTLTSAYTYVLENADAKNIKVVNMSLGGSYNGISVSDRLLINRVKAAYAAGIVTTCAAGNEAGKSKQNGPYLNFPSDWLDECALGVIATDENDARGDFSNYNKPGQKTKDLSAPGVSIYSTAANSGYGYLSGTSMAAPYVAGVAALVYAANPELTAADVSSILCDTARDLGDEDWDEEFGSGLVDAKAAVEAAVASADDGSGDGDGDGSGNNEGDGTGNGASEGDGDPEDNGGSEGDDNGGGAGEGDDNGNGGSDGGGGNDDGSGDNEGDGDPEGDGDAEEEVVNDSATLTDNPADQKRSDINPITETVVTAPAGTKITKLKAGKRSFTVKWKKQAAQTSGYQVQYSLKKSFKSKRKTVTVSKVKTTSKKIKKLKAKKRYYVRVRTFKVVGGERYYSAWSARKSVKTKA